MNKRVVPLLLVTAWGTLCFQGCQHSCHPPLFAPLRPAAAAAPCNPVPAPGTVAPATIPPQPGLQAPAPPAPVFPETRGYEPPLATPAQPSWRPPADPRVQLGAPEPLSVEGQRDGERQRLPEGSPKVTEPPPSSPALPADIAQFASATDQVASGLRPGLDGVKWLRENGYRAVLHLRAPGEDDAADRNLFELKGLKYLTLEFSPQTLPKVVEDFNRIVADKANQPLFVYDKDGVLSGSLWYLHFRGVDKATDEEARAKAIRLGLKTEQDSEMWLAIQKYLSEQGK